MRYREGTAEHQFLVGWSTLVGELPHGAWLEVDSRGEKFQLELHHKVPAQNGSGAGANGKPVWLRAVEFTSPFHLAEANRLEVVRECKEAIARLSSQSTS